MTANLVVTARPEGMAGAVMAKGQWCTLHTRLRGTGRATVRRCGRCISPTACIGSTGLPL
ncbi:hypothetical protein GCM10009780_73680 [Actinomadura alba]